MNEWIDAYKILSGAGFPGLLFALVILSWRGHIRWSREKEADDKLAEERQKDNDARIAQLRQEMADLRKEYDQRETVLRSEFEKREATLHQQVEHWQNKSWDLMERWTGDLETGQALAGVAGRVIGRKGRSP